MGTFFLVGEKGKIGIVDIETLQMLKEITDRIVPLNLVAEAFKGIGIDAQRAHEAGEKWLRTFQRRKP